jgi:NADPH:quinone reductase-like Zn-dependent oxidoreductase
MKAYQYRMGEPISALQIVDVPMPSVGPGQVLVKMRAAALNFRDILVVTGQFPRAQKDVIIPLCDGAGDVVEVGSGVTSVKVGDRVTPLYNQRWMAGDMQDEDTAWSIGGCLDGTAAEYRVFAEMGVLKFPDHLTYEEAATLPCAGVTVWNSLHGLRPLAAGDTLLTLGTGGVSIHALQMAHAAGASVIITSSSDEKLARAKALGADHVINYAQTSDWDVAVRKITGGRGVDHVIENAGGATMLKSINSTRRGGWIHIIGLIAPGKIDPVHILLSGVTVSGKEVGSREMFAAMNRSLAHSKIKPVVDKVFAFDQLAEALGELGTGKHFGKLVLSIP